MGTWAIPWKVHLQEEGGGPYCKTEEAPSVTTKPSEASCFTCLRLHYDKADMGAARRQADERRLSQEWEAVQANLRLSAERSRVRQQKLLEAEVAALERASIKQIAREMEEEARKPKKVIKAKAPKPKPVAKTIIKKNPYTQEDILKHMGLVRWVVGRFLRRCPSHRQQDRDDLVNYGVFGLIYALEYWDWKLGFEFATYAVPCIKGAMLRGDEKLTKSFTPVHNRKYYGSLKGHYVDPVTSLEEALKQMSERSIYQATWGSARGVGRWNAGGVREDHLHSPLPTPFDCSTKSNLERQIRKVLTTLTPREEKVLRMRFGIGEKSDHTLEEVGDDFEVHRERIRQIEAKALRKLRHPARAKRLRAFVE